MSTLHDRLDAIHAWFDARFTFGLLIICQLGQVTVHWNQSKTVHVFASVGCNACVQSVSSPPFACALTGSSGSAVLDMVGSVVADVITLGSVDLCWLLASVINQSNLFLMRLLILNLADLSASSHALFAS